MMHSSVLLVLGLLLVTGLLFSLVCARLKAPRVAAYALAGLIWSPDLLGGVLGLEVGLWSGTLTDTALAIIAYLIGGSVTSSQLQRLGKTIVLSALGESIGAVLVVFTAIWLLLSGGDVAMLPLALLLGSLAATTDAAATVAVIHQYRSSGPLTTTLLGVVALDDAIGIILFSMMLVWTTGASVMDAAVNSAVEIFGALILGAIMGPLLAYFSHRVRNRNFFLPMVFAALFLSQGLAQQWHLSPLLTAMAMGFFARASFQSGGERLFAPIEYLEELVFLIFFTLAGAHFELKVFLQGLDFIAAYVVARIIGKMMGARVAGRVSNAPDSVRQYIGMSLFPQAGVAIGLALSLLNHPAFADNALLIVNIILASTMIYELIGPLATRLALIMAGEVATVEREQS